METDEERQSRALCEQLMKSVVYIRNEDDDGGTGFIVNKEGYIITCQHVVKDSSKVTVQLKDGQPINAEVIHTSSEHDLAVVKANELRGQQHVIFGQVTAELKLRKVLSIGCPRKLLFTAGNGEINEPFFTNLISTYPTQSFIQFSSNTTTGGSSGGPLATLYGLVVGMTKRIIENRAIFCFAIPSDRIIAFLKQNGIDYELFDLTLAQIEDKVFSLKILYRAIFKENETYIAENIYFDKGPWLRELRDVIDDNCRSKITLALNNKKKVNVVVDYLIKTNDIKKYKAFIAVWKVQDPALAEQFKKNVTAEIADKDLEQIDNFF